MRELKAEVRSNQYVVVGGRVVLHSRICDSRAISRSHNDPPVSHFWRSKRPVFSDRAIRGPRLLRELVKCKVPLFSSLSFCGAGAFSVMPTAG